MKRDKETILAGVGALVLLAVAVFGLMKVLNHLRGAEEQKEQERYMAEMAQYDSLLSNVRFHMGVLDYDKSFEALDNTREYLLLSPPKMQEWENLRTLLIDETIQRAVNLDSLGNYKEASHYFELYIQHKADEWLSRELMIKMVNCYEKSGKGAEAVELLDEFVEANPKAYDLLLYKARVLRNASWNNEALEALNAAVKYITKDYQSRHGAAYALLIDPNHYDWPSYHYEIFCERAEVCASLGKLKEAKASYGWAQFIQPNQGRAYYAEACAKKKEGQPSQACRLWKKAQKFGWKEDKEGLGCS